MGFIGKTIGIVLIVSALGLIKTTLPPLIGFLALSRERALGKALACLLAVILQVGLGFFMVRLGIGYVRTPREHLKQAGVDPEILSRNNDLRDLKVFISSLEAANAASRVIDRSGGQSPIMSDADATEMVRNHRAALKHAERVDAHALEAKYSGWGTHFDAEFRTGLRLVVKGYTEPNATQSLAGQKLMDTWGDWFNQNVDGIRKLK